MELSDAGDKELSRQAFAVPQSTFTTGDDRPLPGGDANEVGNERPETPFTTCGMAIAPRFQVFGETASDHGWIIARAPPSFCCDSLLIDFGGFKHEFGPYGWCVSGWGRSAIQLGTAARVGCPKHTSCTSRSTVEHIIHTA